MKKTPLAILLALSMILSLAGCQSLSPNSSPDPSEQATITADLTQDILAFSAGCSQEDVALTVNGEDVPANLFLYWLSISCSFFSNQSASPSGVSLKDNADQILEDTVTMATYYTLIRQKAGEYGALPTDAQLAAAQEAMFAKGEEHYERLKAVYGLNDEAMKYVFIIDAYYSNLLDAAVPTPTEEQLNNYVYQTKHILLSTVDTSAQRQDDGTFPSLDQKTVAEKRALAEDILSQLQAVDGEERLALFDQLMNQYSEDGRDEDGNLAVSDGYIAVPGNMDPAYEQASLALKIGELSGIVESSYGYHIILRGQVDDPSSHAGQYRENQLDQLLEEWVTQSTVKRAKLLDDLDVADYYARFTAWQTAFAEANSDAASESPDVSETPQQTQPAAS